jgi:autotransporter-associated beta strand protein
VLTTTPPGQAPAAGATGRIAGSLTLSSATLSVGSSVDVLSIDANLTAPSGLNKTGAGNLILTGVNSFGGPITISGGTLTAVSATSLGSASIILAGGVFSAQGNFANPISLGAGGGIFDVPAQQTFTNNAALSGAGGFTKTGSGTLQLRGNNAGLGGAVTLTAGTIDIDADSRLGAASLMLNAGALHAADNLTTTRQIQLNGGAFSAAAGKTLTIGAGATLSGAGIVTKTGGGTVAINATYNYAGSTTVSAGTLAANSISPATLSGGVLSAGEWTVESGGAIVTLASLNITTNLASVTLRGANSIFSNIDTLSDNEGRFAIDAGRTFSTGSNFTNGGAVTVGASSVLKINGTLTNTGSIDISGGAVINYSGATPATSVRDQILAAFNGGAWTGGQGIGSSAATANVNSGHRTAIGFAEASDLGVGSFMNVSVDGTSLLIRYTLAGDSNLDGAVDLTDFTYLAASFNGSNKLWNAGDFDYSGIVDLTDFTFLASNFNVTLAAGAVGDTGLASDQVGSPVPEPTLLPLVLATGSLTRRRRQAAVHQ